MSMNISIENYTKTIRGVVLLNNINYEFHSGNIYGVVGENGSGKTMLLRAITGLITATSGIIKVNNAILGKSIDFPHNMGLIIEKPEFINYLSGYENLKLIADLKQVISEDKIKEYMNMFNMDPASKKPMKKYSLGMKQKIGIIQAIMENPDLLILDEPFNALDKESVAILRAFLLKLKEQDKLIIITSHNHEDIETLCNHTVSISNGVIQN